MPKETYSDPRTDEELIAFAESLLAFYTPDTSAYKVVKLLINRIQEKG